MLRLLPLILLFSLEAQANWLCRVAASEKNGNTINACGIAESVFENEARANSLKAAQLELESMCNTSPDCNNYEVIIKPLRTDCEKQADGLYKCWRGIEASITNREREDRTPRKFSDGIAVPVRAMVVQTDGGEGIKRSVIEFKSVPSGADVSVDGIELCQTPCSRELQYGKHTVSYSKKDFTQMTEDVYVDEKSSEITWALSDKFGSIVLKNVPKGSVVRVDDLVNTSEIIRMIPGTHVVTIEGKNHQPFAKQVVIEKGKVQEVVFDAAVLYGFIEISAKDPKGNAIKGAINIDGLIQKETTPAKIKVPAGEHTISVTSGKLGKGLTQVINPNKVLVMNLVLVEDYKPVAVKKVSRTECMSNDDCAEGKICATVRGEYPGNCAEEGKAFFDRILDSAKSPDKKDCNSDAECGEGFICAPVRGEFPGSCAEKGGDFFKRIFGN